MRRALGTALFGAALLIAGACTKTRADEGLDATLLVKGAQFYRDDLPVGTDGPKVVSASTDGIAYAGQIRHGLSGDLEASATAVAIALAGDVGYWIVPARIASIAAPLTPTFVAQFGVAKTAVPGPHQVIFRAVDGDGRFGLPLARPLTIAVPALPQGPLVVSLTWDNHADLDLHVVLPTGIELFKGNRTEYQHPPPGAGAVSRGTPTDGGVLDRDSNAQCVADGAGAEDAVWTEPPPLGPYVVRVDTFSLCGEPSAPWRLTVVRDGVLIHSAEGTATDSDLRFPHGRGAGLLALEFTL